MNQIARKAAIATGILLGGALGAGLGMVLGDTTGTLLLLQALGGIAGGWFGGLLVQTILDSLRPVDEVPDKGEMSVRHWGWWMALAMGLLGPILKTLALVAMIWPG